MARAIHSVLLICMVVGAPAAPAQDTHAGIVAFNAALSDATRNMDNPATLALWEEDGVSLLPSTPPIIRKPAIAKFMADVMASLSGARMTGFELHCTDIAVHGNWASEWCTEHQHVVFANGKPPFDGGGKMLFVLHRGVDRAWRIKREMWNAA
ncbi:MAG: DUF4440 domain-containing protein [Alphaproteobacteria bacterium]|nr:DUF4440 domain-containing protein [Alphaproteobacteria bacterium]MDE2042006.1 DUF4440 domain-containing protein [Alphaproteobacteria bacterium]MDE2340059.1 DUF4440 domain-containing protein [Alphaproteobacteria bacterium]